MVEKEKDQPVRFISWEEIVKNVKILAQKIPKKNRIYIFPIPTNGYVIAGLIAYYRKDMIFQFSPKPHTGASILLLDDIHDTGKTMNKYMDNAITDVISATLYWRTKEAKADGKPNAPDYWSETVEDNSWLVFPWEETT